MSLNDDTVASRMEAALTAAGDIAYDWHLPSDSIVWRGQLGETVGIADSTALATGKALASRIDPEDLAARQHRLDDHFAGTAAFDCDYRLRGEDGRFRWVQDRGRAERDETGRVIRVLGIMRVITARKVQEFRLERLAN
jgi:PAS domain-containing protein